MLFKKISVYWWCQILGWMAYALIYLFFAYTFNKLEPETFKYIAALILDGIFVTHLLRAIIIKGNWLELSFEKLILRAFIAVAFCAFIYASLAFAFNYFTHFLHRKHDFIGYYIRSFLNGATIISLWTMIYFVWHYVERSRKTQLDKLKLEAVVKGLELKTIKSQLNPHFIFNALNSIRALIDENPSRARRAITELSNILRNSMQAEKVEIVSLENEINIVKDYLELEHIRFEERLEVKYNIDPATLDMPVPPMMLQTLVENAIKHGISKSITGGIVSIDSKLTPGAHALLIRNTGQMAREVNGHGFGLESTRHRLKLIFGEKASFSIHNLPDNMVEAKVIMPIKG